MKHPTDTDLDFLHKCNKEELEFLVKLIIEEGGMTNQLKGKRAYSANVADPTKYVDEIIDEIQRYAGNTVCNLFRGHGVVYREALIDVLKSLKVRFDKRQELPTLEELLLEIGLDQYLKKMKTKDAEKAFRRLLDNIGTLSDVSACTNGLGAGDIAAGAGTGAAGAVGGATIGGGGVAGGVAGGAAKLATGVGTIVGGGSIIVAAAVGAVVGIAGWGGFYLSGPAKRVVVPAVIYIAKLRKCMIEQKRI